MMLTEQKQLKAREGVLETDESGQCCVTLCCA